MKVSEAFLVNTKNFDAIIETLASLDRPATVINTALLESLGFSDPNDLLVIRILKEFEIINNDGTPGKFFEEFTDSQTTRLALAKGLVHAYEGLFDRDSSIHHKPAEKVREEFHAIFKDEKTDLIIKYLSGTFVKISSYCGTSLVDEVLGERLQEVVAGDEDSMNASAVHTNGSHAGNNGANGDRSDNSNIYEEIGTKNVDDIIKKFDRSRNTIDEFDSVFFGEESVEKNDEAENISSSVPETPSESGSAAEEFDVFGLDNMPDDHSDEKIDNEQTAAGHDNDDDDVNDNDNIDEFDFFGEDSEELPEETATAPEEPKIENDETADTAEPESPEEPEEPLVIDDGFTVEPVAEETSGRNNQSDSNNELVRKATLRKAELLYKLQRWDELLPALEQIIEKYDDTKSPDLQEAVSRAVIRRAAAVMKLKRSNEILPALNAVINRLENSEVKEFYNHASMAMLYKAKILEKRESADDLLPLYGKIVKRLDGHSDPSIRQKVDAIHFKRFDLIVKSGNQQEVLDASTRLVNRFRDSADDQDSEYLKLAMIKRAEILEELNRDEEALQAYEEFLETFGK